MSQTTIHSATHANTESSSPLAIPNLHALHHVGLTVSDVERSEPWYANVFGFERVMVEAHHGSGDGYTVVLNRPGTPIFIGLDHHVGGDASTFDERRTGLDHLAFGVTHRDELDRWVSHFDALGLAHSGINDVTEPFPFATLIVRDPDNIQLELTWMG